MLFDIAKEGRRFPPVFKDYGNEEMSVGKFVVKTSFAPLEGAELSAMSAGWEVGQCSDHGVVSHLWTFGLSSRSYYPPYK